MTPVLAQHLLQARHDAGFRDSTALSGVGISIVVLLH
jgi:hypothetical protein